MDLLDNDLLEDYMRDCFIYSGEFPGKLYCSRYDVKKPSIYYCSKEDPSKSNQISDSFIEGENSDIKCQEDKTIRSLKGSVEKNQILFSVDVKTNLNNSPLSNNKISRLYIKKGVRFYSTNKLIKSKPESNLVDRDSVSLLISRLEFLCENNKYASDNKTQEAIENFCLEQFSLLGDRESYKSVEGVKIDSVSNELSKYIMDKLPVLKQYINMLVSSLESENDRLLNSKKTKGLKVKKRIISKTDKEDLSVESNSVKNKFSSSPVDKTSKPVDISRDDLVIIKNKLLIEVIEGLGTKVLSGSCIFIFYSCLTFWESGDEKDADKLTLVPMSIKIGSSLINKYLYDMYTNSREDLSSEIDISFSVWKKDYLNLSYNYFLYDDTFISEFGCKLIDILESSSLVKKELTRSSYKEQKYILSVYDNNILVKFGNKKVHVLPFKLPMVVEPKDYTSESLGGYLLNNVKTSDGLIIEKSGYKHTSELNNSSIIYKLVNGVSKVPYKINQELLDFVINNKHLGLLIDNTKPHKYQDINRTKYQDKVYKSYVSKLLLQENILDIASIYRNFSKIYFPVRIDQRGRLYCSSAYFNYQSTELSKALLLFARPGIVERGDNKAIDYLKSHGANSFGGSLDKKSINVKIK